MNFLKKYDNIKKTLNQGEAYGADWKSLRQLRESRNNLAETSNWGTNFRRLCYLALKQVRVNFR